MRLANRLENRLLVTVCGVAAASIAICAWANIHRECTERLRFMVRSADQFSDTIKSSPVSANICPYWGANRVSNPHFGLRMDSGRYEGPTRTQRGRTARGMLFLLSDEGWLQMQSPKGGWAMRGIGIVWIAWLLVVTATAQEPVQREDASSGAVEAGRWKYEAGG